MYVRLSFVWPGMVTCPAGGLLVVVVSVAAGVPVGLALPATDGVAALVDRVRGPPPRVDDGLGDIVPVGRLRRWFSSSNALTSLDVIDGDSSSRFPFLPGTRTPTYSGADRFL